MTNYPFIHIFFSSDDTHNSSQNDDDSDTPAPPTKILQSTNNLVDKSANVR